MSGGELLGWVGAIGLSVLIVFAVLAGVVNLVRGMRKPRP